MTCGRHSAWLIAALCLFATQIQQVLPAAAQPATDWDITDVGWVPTSPVMVGAMLDLANVNAGDNVVDLGSGDGRAVIAAAQRGARARGIEFDQALVEISKHNAALSGVSDRATFEHADIFEADFSNADVVMLYLLPKLMERLRPIILRMKPGTRVVSNSFGLGGWLPDRTATVAEECSLYFCRALLWIVPASIDGTWTMDDGNAAGALSGKLALTQTFQNFNGTLATRDGALPITEGRLKGSDITFNAGGIQYTGEVKGAVIEGTSRTGGSWRARRDS